MTIEEPLKFAKLTFADAVLQLYDSPEELRQQVIPCFRSEMKKAEDDAHYDFQKHSIKCLKEAFQDLCDYKLLYGVKE